MLQRRLGKGKAETKSRVDEMSVEDKIRLWQDDFDDRDMVESFAESHLTKRVESNWRASLIEGLCET